MYLKQLTLSSNGGIGAGTETTDGGRDSQHTEADSMTSLFLQQRKGTMRFNILPLMARLSECPREGKVITRSPCEFTMKGEARCRLRVEYVEYMELALGSSWWGEYIRNSPSQCDVLSLNT